MGGEQNGWCRKRVVNKRRGEQTVVNKRRGEQTVVVVNKLGEHRVHAVGDRKACEQTL